MNQGFLGYFSGNHEPVVASKLIAEYFQGFPFYFEPTIQTRMPVERERFSALMLLFCIRISRLNKQRNKNSQPFYSDAGLMRVIH